MGAPQYEQAGADIAGTGTVNYLAKWTAGSTLGNSVIYDNGTNVGIGTASPGSKLDVWSTDTVGGSSASTARAFFTGAKAANTGASLGFGGYYTGTTPTIYSYIVGASDTATAGDFGGHIQFWTRANGGAYGERARIDSSGNVGIGTASPGYRLDVQQTDTYPAYIRRTNNSGAAAACALVLDGRGTFSANYAGIEFQTAGVKMGQIIQESGGNFYYDYNSPGTGGTLYFRSAGSPMMVLTSGGNLSLQGATATAGRAITTNSDLDIFGVRVGRGAGAVSTNTAIGSSALNANTSGNQNTAVGNFALNANNTAASNSMVGFQAGASTTGGSRNTAVGESALYANTTGTDNTAVGRYAAVYNTGSSNTAVGATALNGVNGSSTGAANTAIGYQAGLAITSGYNNVLVGYGAGNNITTGGVNICLGVNATTAAATDSNKLVIGSSGNYVATNGGATTYFATAGALQGYIQVVLNGTTVKIPVYAV